LATERVAPSAARAVAQSAARAVAASDEIERDAHVRERPTAVPPETPLRKMHLNTTVHLRQIAGAKFVAEIAE